jgi:hypothetical protein
MATHDTVINQKSLTSIPQGLSLALTVPWYRSLWVSSISTISVAVDGVDISQDKLQLSINGKTFSMEEVPKQWEELWFMQDRAYLEIDLGAPATVGANT